MDRRWERLLGIAGIVSGAVVGLAILVGGNESSIKSTGEQVVAHYASRTGSTVATAFLAVLGAVLLLFFGGALRRVLTPPDGGSPFASIAMAGTSIYAVGLLFEAVLRIALSDVGDKHLVAAAPALNVLENDDFFLFVGAIAVIALATAAATLSRGRLPMWFGWISLVLGVLALAGPVGAAAFLFFPLWLIVAGVLVATGGASTRSER
jgi:hypothetical protein